MQVYYSDEPASGYIKRPSGEDKEQFKRLPKGHICDCGARHRWVPYVYAHEHIPLVFTCPSCNAKVIIYRYSISDPISSSEGES